MGFDEGNGMADKGFSAEEKLAMKERAKELKAAGKKADFLKDLQAKIAEMPSDQRTIAQRIHEIVMETAPGLTPKTWYGQPAWADDDGQVVCFFQSAHKFGTRYSTLGFNEASKLDDGSMWPTSYAILSLTAADEKTIAALVTKAVG